MVTVLNPPTRGDGRRIAIVATRFTKDLSQRMVDDAVETLQGHGVAAEDIALAWVPGSFELPLVCDEFAGSGEWDGVIALGCVVRGETSHYDYVCDAATEGVLKTSLRHNVPVMFGVLTTETTAQAIARVDGTKSQKGAECATAVLDMIGVIDEIRG